MPGRTIIYGKASKNVRISQDAIDEILSRIQPDRLFGITMDDAIRYVIGLPPNTHRAKKQLYGKDDNTSGICSMCLQELPE